MLARDSHPGIEWLVIGEGPLRTRLEARVRQTKAMVTFIGFRDTPWNSPKRAGVLVHVPSSEGLGTVLLEALARGMPVVASHVGGIPEFVEPRVGALIKPGDPRELLRQVVRWLDDSERIKTAALYGPRIARKFSADRMVEGTLEAYGLAADN